MERLLTRYQLQKDEVQPLIEFLERQGYQIEDSKKEDRGLVIYTTITEGKEKLMFVHGNILRPYNSPILEVGKTTNPFQRETLSQLVNIYLITLQQSPPSSQLTRQ